ncbi:glycosyltransferase involved in cell wall biosynthesis [Bradyrhizobium sp. LM2.7]
MSRICYFGPDQPGSYSGSPFYFASALRSRMKKEGLGDIQTVRTPRTREVMVRAIIWGMLKRSDPRVYNISIEFLDRVLHHTRLEEPSVWIYPLQAIPTALLLSDHKRVRIAQFIDCTFNYLIDGYRLESRLSRSVRRSLLDREHESYLRADAIFCFHEGIRQEITNRHGIARDKIRTIGRGVNIDGAFQDLGRESSSKLLKMIFVGADAQRKGLFELILAIDRLADSQRDRIELTVIGPPANKVPKRSYVRAKGFLGVEHRESVLALMEEADIGVLLSSAEGLPGFIWEMLYLGKPVLVANLPHYDELPAGFPIIQISQPVKVEEVTATLSKLIDGTLRFSTPSAELRRTLSWETQAKIVTDWITTVAG